MSDDERVLERLEQALEALERIPVSLSGITDAAQFFESGERREKLDSLTVILMAVGETIKRVDRETEGRLLSRYPEVDWKGVMGVRDVIAHDYFDIDAEEILHICRQDVPPLIDTLRTMINDLRKSAA